MMDPEEWIIQITKIFESLDIHEVGEHIKLAVHCLTHSAYQWWLETTRIRSMDLLTLNDFADQFDIKFHPRDKKQRLMD